MNFQYLEDLDYEFLNSRCDLKRTVLSLNENCTEKSSSDEKKEKEIKTSLEGLTLKELARHLKYAFLSKTCDYISFILWYIHGLFSGTRPDPSPVLT